MELIVPHTTIRRVPGSRQLCYVEHAGECDLPGSAWLLDFLLGEVCALVLENCGHSAGRNHASRMGRSGVSTEERPGVGFVVGMDSLSAMLEPDVADEFGYSDAEALQLLERAIRTCERAGYIRTARTA
jgi:hypothetical protein